MAFRRFLAAVGMFVGAPALAAEMSISVEIPQLQVAEYHRPYVAFWLERDGAHAANLAVWYQLEKGENGKKGEEWLKDMRQWWRRSGRTLEMPVDGISGATKAPGVHNLSFAPGQGVLAELPAGEYQLLVEAAREVGGRELLKIPFQWPPKKEETLSAKGSSELGTLNLKLIP
ncbi:MAG: DUF2271 domain-containing protein [Cellvibrionaceae bacterium]|nr:DUF2271 domain-containing protein [Cellvibrionaceae bacterium]